MIHIYLCDDNSAVLMAFGEQIREAAKKYFLDIHISTFESGEQLLFCFEDMGKDPDIIFLDIVMGRENGLDTARKLRAQGCRAELIFLTANPEYVFDSFDVSPANYILKNQMSKKRLEEVLLKAVDTVKNKVKTMFLCENGSVKKSIPVFDILYFEVQNRLVTVYYGGQSFEFYSSLEEAEQKLQSPAFVRVHRSYLINLSFVDRIERNFIVLSNGSRLPLGVTYVKKVKESMNRYFAHTHV